MYVFELLFTRHTNCFALITCRIYPLSASFTHKAFTRSHKLILALIHATRKISKTHLDITITEKNCSYCRGHPLD